MFKNMKLSTKLLIVLLIVGIVPFAVISVVSLVKSSGALSKQAFNQLRGVREIKKSQIEIFFEERKDDAEVLAETVGTLRTEAFNKLKAVHAIKKTQLEGYFGERIKLLDDVQHNLRFTEGVNLFSEAFKNGLQSPEYIELSKARDEGFSIFMDIFGFYDVFLIDADGNIIYSVTKQTELGENVNSGTLRKSGLARVFANSRHKHAIEDYSWYEPSKEPAAFLGTPLIDKTGKYIGCAAFRISQDDINNIMHERSGMRKTGEVYIVGADKRMRSNSYIDPKEHSVLASFAGSIKENGVDTAASREAIEGKNGSDVIRNYNNNLVLSVFSPLNIYGLDWVIIAEIDVAEAFCPVNENGEYFFSKYIAKHDYHDLFLINPDGYCFYTVRRGVDYQTNLLNGKYSGSNLGKLVRGVISTKEYGIVDFAPYVPNNNEPASFIAQPVIDPVVGKLEIVVVLQLPIDAINNIMQEREGMGKTGETYLVGSDKLMRSDSFLDPVNRSMVASFTNPNLGRVDTEAVNEAIAGKTGTKIIIDYNGNPVLSAYMPLTVGDTTWALLAEIDKSEAFAAVNTLKWIIYAIATFGIAAIIGVVLFLIRIIILPIKKLIHATIEIRNGRLDTRIAIDSQDEIGLLSNSFMEMTDDLRTKTIENDKQNWIKSGLANLGEKLRGEHSVHVLARSIINYLTPYLNAKIGAIYVSNGDEILKLVGSYAFVRRKNLSDEFKFGEGVIGQAAVEKQSILITNIPDNYIRIISGLGEAFPKNILVTPFLYEGVVKGVIEIGTFGEFTDTQIDFLELVAEPIAIAFNTASERIHTQELLVRTQTQAEELQTREEELKASNEELEGQAENLKESEAKLQAQQEELRSINEELEERSGILEKQKKAIEKKNQELEESRKQVEIKAQDLEMASKYKSEFLANMSHELRTPLNSMLILSNRLAKNKNGTLTEKEMEYASTVHSSGKDLLVLINDILDLSKVEAGKLDLHLSDVHLSDICEELKLKFLPLASDKGLSFNINIAKEVPDYISTDIKRLGQIIKNLISNAFKFTHEGGVTIDIDLPHHDVKFLASILNQANVIAISVSDTGIGIPEDRKRVIFESFQQADGSVSRKYGGTGLGLSISRELARLLCGEIQLQSEEGKGSVFTLYIPVKIEEMCGLKPGTMGFVVNGTKAAEIEKLQEDDKMDCQGGAAKETTPYNEKNQNSSAFSAEPAIDDRNDIYHEDKAILVIEDDPNFAKVLYDVAKEKGFKCLIAGDGETGLQFAEYFKPKGIVLDMILPGINGWDVMERLKDNLCTRNIPIHIISGTEKNIKAMQMGAIGFLSKPVSIETLWDAFTTIEEAATKKIKKVLIVESDQKQVDKIIDLIEDSYVTYAVAKSNEKAYAILKSEKFDCVIMGMLLYDVSEFDLLRKIKEDGNIALPPIISYSDKMEKISLNKNELKLEELPEDIVLKTAFSSATLLDAVTLFLHTVEKNLPEEKREMLRLIHDKEVMLRGKKVLIVDDDERNVFALSSVLEEYGMKILVGTTGKEGLECLKNNLDIDLVLMDIMLPEMDGYETIRVIRMLSEYKNIPIIALTAKAMKGDRNKCIEAGASDYIAKPVETDKLLSLLRVWLYK